MEIAVVKSSASWDLGFIEVLLYELFVGKKMIEKRAENWVSRISHEQESKVIIFMNMGLLGPIHN